MKERVNHQEHQTISRRALLAGGAVVAAFALSGCNDEPVHRIEESTPVPTAAPTATIAAEKYICPPYVYEVHDGDTAESIAGEQFPDQPTELIVGRMVIVGDEDTPVSEVRPGDQLRYIDPDCL